jgi:hypothetical protein
MKTVFISSTYQDLAEHRRAVWQVLEGFNVAVRGMEQFGARTEAALDTCLAEVEQSDVYVGISAFRLGSLDGASGKSFTQLEYERAYQLRKTVLVYLADETAARVRYTDIDVEPIARERLAAFKTTLRERHTVSTFTTPEDLAEKIRRDFSRELEARTPAAPDGEFEATVALVNRFMLVPKTVIGREVRLRVSFVDRPFPASRALCKAFNLEYGASVGCRVKVVAPDGDAQKFRELYAGGQSVARFLDLAKSPNPVDLYARLQFADQNVLRIEGVFFAYSFYGDPDIDDDPYEHYVPAEGKAVLLFSKEATAAT